ncbi:hypothetical protein WAG10_18415 [Bacillus cereus]
MQHRHLLWRAQDVQLSMEKYLEATHRLNTIILDKTGTVTNE